MIESFSRRTFLVGSTSFVASGLLLGYSPSNKPQIGFDPSVYIHIDHDGNVTFIVHRAEMGQWARTTCVLLLAEELRIDPKSITILQADGEEKYGDQNTDGSTTVKHNWEPLRQAGATARTMLISAAALLKKAPEKQFHAENGMIVYAPSGEKIHYKSLVAIAAKLPVPKDPVLLSDASNSYFAIGKDWIHFDTANILTGRAQYGTDIEFPAMLYASLQREPTHTGTLKSLDETAAKAIPGVVKICQFEAQKQPINCPAAVAVIADNYWSAFKARNLLQVTWSNPITTSLEDSTTLRQQMLARVAEPLPKVHESGNPETANDYPKIIRSAYYTPYLTHAPMEPLVATALFKDGSVTVWAPHQDPQTAKKTVALALKIPPEKVTIKVSLLGGGFGRKCQSDFVVEAARLAKEVPGRPVQVLWTREDDMQHGYYHAACAQFLEAKINHKGEIGSLLHRSHFPTFTSLKLEKSDKHDPFELEMGLTNNFYMIPYKRMEAAVAHTNLRVGWFRGVCDLFHSFAINLFFNRIAREAGIDPIEFRLRHLDQKAAKPKDPYAFNIHRLRTTIEKVKEISQWGKTSPGIAQGFACHSCRESYVACVIDGMVDTEGKFKAKTVHMVADCGIAINQDGIHAQLEGSIIMGLANTLYGKITATNGVVNQQNFDTYQVLRIDETPQFNINIIPSTEKPSGIGEPGVPVIAPAYAASYESATNKVVTELPLSTPAR